MGERKVLNKYFDPNFNPKFLPKRSFRSTQCIVTMMMPFSMRCMVCGQYSNVGTKFNMRMEECKGEDYLGILRYRFFVKCRTCANEMSFKTDPKNHDYVVEQGGVRGYDPWRDMQNAEKMLEHMREQDEEGNAMRYLENRTTESKRQMDIMDAIDETEHLNKRKTKFTPDELLKQLIQDPEAKLKETEMKEVQKAFVLKHVKKIEDEELANENQNQTDVSNQIDQSNLNKIEQSFYIKQNEDFQEQEQNLFILKNKIKIKSKNQQEKIEYKDNQIQKTSCSNQDLLNSQSIKKKAIVNFDYSDDD